MEIRLSLEISAPLFYNESNKKEFALLKVALLNWQSIKNTIILNKRVCRAYVGIAFRTQLTTKVTLEGQACRVAWYECYKTLLY